VSVDKFTGSSQMRILGLVVALLAAFSMSAAAQTDQHGHMRQDGTNVQGHRRSSPGSTSPDTARIATGNPDPYIQRYYSHSEGWTYYTLPSYSSGRKSDDE
jgi:hypothetical protein